MLAAPWALLLVVPALALALAPWVRRPPVLAVATAEAAAAARHATWRTRLRRLPDVVRVLALLLIVLALARPREGLAVTVLPEEGLDIVAVVDVSTSMRTGMGNESRLSAAQRVLGEFTHTVEGDRLGLVIFQERALTLSPLTADLSAIRARIERLEPGLVNDGTAIGLGIAEALTLLQDSPARSRIVVLLTDGENNAGEVDPGTAARVAEALGVRIYSIGFARGSADATALEQIAETTGGAYYDARTPEDLADAYEAVRTLERSRIGERRFVAFREYAPALALGAVALLLVEGVLRTTWLRRLP